MKDIEYLQVVLNGGLVVGISDTSYLNFNTETQKANDVLGRVFADGWKYANPATYQVMEGCVHSFVRNNK